MRLHMFEVVEWDADGAPVVVCWYTDNHAQQAIIRFPLSLLEQLRQHAYNALGRPPVPPTGGARRSRPRGVRTPPSTRTASAETRARAVWQPGMSVAELTRAASISRSAASKWTNVLRGEDREEIAL
jgi:hypothetical protein